MVRNRESHGKNWASHVALRVKHLPTMRETWVLSPGQEDPLEKEMAAHSSTLAWNVPRMEEPGRLQSMGSKRVGHNSATSLQLQVVKARSVCEFLFVFFFPYFLVALRSMGDLCSPNRCRTVPPALKVQHFNHWTARGSP